MPRITIKNELKLFKIKLDALVNKIEENFFRIEMKNTIWGIHDLMILQISYIDEMIKELEETENISVTQKEMLNQVRENSAGDSAPNLVSEPVLQS